MLRGVYALWAGLQLQSVAQAFSVARCRATRHRHTSNGLTTSTAALASHHALVNTSLAEYTPTLAISDKASGVISGRQHAVQATIPTATAAAVAFPVECGAFWMDGMEESLCCVQ